MHFFIVFKGLPAESANLAKAEFLSHTKADEALAVVLRKKLSLVYKTQCARILIQFLMYSYPFAVHICFAHTVKGNVLIELLNVL